MPTQGGGSWVAAKKIWNGIASPHRFQDNHFEHKFQTHFLTHNTANSKIPSVFLPIVFISRCLGLSHLFLTLSGWADLMDIRLIMGVLVDFVLLFLVAWQLSVAWNSSNALHEVSRTGRTLVWLHTAVIATLGLTVVLSSYLPGSSKEVYSTMYGIRQEKFAAVLAYELLAGIQIHPTFSDKLLSGFWLIAARCIALLDHTQVFEEAQVLAAASLIQLVFALFWYGSVRQRWLLNQGTATFQRVFRKKLEQQSDSGGDSDYFPRDQFCTFEKALQEELQRICARAARQTKPRKQANIYTVNARLGSGSYGVVHLVKNRDSGMQHALKDSSLSSKPKSSEKALWREYSILRLLQHPNIVQFEGAIVWNGTPAILLEYCEAGSLAGILKKGVTLNDYNCSVCAAHIVSAVHYIHILGLAHFDIKPHNMLIRQGVLKLSDFGSAAWLQAGQTDKDDTSSLWMRHGKHKNLHGTKAYMSPEIWSKAQCGRKADIWAMGCSLVELATHTRICALPEETSKWSKEGLKLPPMPPMRRDVEDFVRLCLSIDPAERATSYQLSQHPYVQGLSGARIESLVHGGQCDPSVRRPWTASYWIEFADKLHGTFQDPELEQKFTERQILPKYSLMLTIGKWIHVCRGLILLVEFPGVDNLQPHGIMIYPMYMVFTVLWFYPLPMDVRLPALRFCLRTAFFVEILQRTIFMYACILQVALQVLMGWLFHFHTAESFFWQLVYLLVRIVPLVLKLLQQAPDATGSCHLSAGSIGGASGEWSSGECSNRSTHEQEEIYCQIAVHLLVFSTNIHTSHEMLQVERQQFLEKRKKPQPSSPAGGVHSSPQLRRSPSHFSNSNSSPGVVPCMGMSTTVSSALPSDAWGGYSLTPSQREFRRSD